MSDRRREVRRASPAALAASVGVALAIVAACGVGELDQRGKACPCGGGWACDTARNVCVPPEELTTGVDSGPVGEVDAGCRGLGCACAVDGDCIDPTAPKCVGGKCVECKTTPDSCPAGRYCLPTNQCAPGCRTNEECAALSPSAPFCNTGRHQCVACAGDGDCTGGKKCSPAGACVESCTDDGGTCAVGVCCSGLCIDTKSDPLNCNACGNACAGAGALCCAGACTNPLTNAAHCGKCGSACSTTNGTPSCVAGNCNWACNTGFSHCVTGNTGCETSTSSNVAKCGSCTKDCNVALQNANGVACVASACTYTTCKTDYGNCDGNATNGCECACGKGGQRCCPGEVCVAGKHCESDGECH